MSASASISQPLQSYQQLSETFRKFTLGAEGFKRKINAIMSADIVGYSKLTGYDKAVIVQVLAVYKT